MMGSASRSNSNFGGLRFILKRACAIGRGQLGRIRSILERRGDVEGDLRKRGKWTSSVDGHRPTAACVTEPCRCADNAPTPTRVLVKGRGVRRLRRRRLRARSNNSVQCSVLSFQRPLKAAG